MQDEVLISTAKRRRCAKPSEAHTETSTLQEVAISGGTQRITDYFSPQPQSQTTGDDVTAVPGNSPAVTTRGSAVADTSTTTSAAAERTDVSGLDRCEEAASPGDEEEEFDPFVFIKSLPSLPPEHAENVGCCCP